MSRGIPMQIPKTKHDIEEVCKIRHEFGRAGFACCNCIYCDMCGKREDKPKED